MRAVLRYVIGRAIGAVLAAAALCAGFPAIGIAGSPAPIGYTEGDPGSASAATFPFSLLLLTDEGVALRQWNMRPGDRVEIGFTHSSEHVRVFTMFELEGGELHAVETRMEGYGPGLAWDAAPVEGEALLSRQPMALTHLTLRVGSGTGHWLGLPGERVDLSSLVPPGQSSAVYIVEVTPSEAIP